MCTLKAIRKKKIPCTAPKYEEDVFLVGQDQLARAARCAARCAARIARLETDRYKCMSHVHDVTRNAHDDPTSFSDVGRILLIFCAS